MATNSSHLTQSSGSTMFVPGGGGGARGYSHILTIRVCAPGKGMVFKPFTLG